MTLTLFDSFQRTRMGPAQRTEPKFAYWNESARPEFGPVRVQLEQWFERYPQHEAADLRRRFRSTDKHLSALFELFIHEQLRAAGFAVVCHPTIIGTAKTPDFLASRGEQSLFYVECVLAASDVKKSARERIRDVALDAIDQVKSADYFVKVVVDGQPTGSLPIGRTQLVRHLEAWLRTLDPNAVAQVDLTGLPGAFPTWTWEGAGVRLVFTAHALKPGARGRGHRLIGWQADGKASLMNVDEMIEGAIKKKATRYQQLGLPYLIAINVLDFPVDSDDVELALARSWGTASAPKNRRVSGVLLATVWHGLSAVRRQPELVLNPNGSYPIAPGLLPFHEYEGATLDC